MLLRMGIISYNLLKINHKIKKFRIVLLGLAHQIIPIFANLPEKLTQNSAFNDGQNEHWNSTQSTKNQAENLLNGQKIGAKKRIFR